MAKCFGQGSETLAWFWQIGPSEDKLTGEWMEECEPIYLLNSLYIDLLFSLSCELASSQGLR